MSYVEFAIRIVLVTRSICSFASASYFARFLTSYSCCPAHHTTPTPGAGVQAVVYSSSIRQSYLLSDALLPQELAAIPGELLVGDARGAAELRGLQGGQRQLHLGRGAMGSRAAWVEMGQERVGGEQREGRRLAEQ